MEKLKEKFKSCPEVLNALLFILGACLVIYLSNNYFAIFAPFIIAYVITQLMHPLMAKIRSKLKVPNLLNTILCFVIFVIVAGFILWVLGHYVIEGITYLINLLSSESTINSIVSFAHNISGKLNDLMEFVNIEISMSDINGMVSDFAKNAIQVLSNLSLTLAMSLPNLLMAFIIGCVAAFYMLYDYDKISAAISKRLSPQTKKWFDVFHGQVLSSFMKMILSYALMSVICFGELLVGFMILGIKDASFIALIIAILDVLPILGSGAVLIPCGIIALLVGQPKLGIGLLILYGVITVVRQILEPKIVGSQIGLYPLITLASLYLGLKLMGGVGLIVAPLYVIFFKKLCEEKLIGFPDTQNQKKTEMIQKKKDKKRN